MSKRLIFPQQYGERKKAKLNISVSDHNFPLSQSSVSNKDQNDNWGDDNDDEMLLLASQACEEAFKDPNLSILPNYSMCMQPSSTSTQIGEPQPSSSSSSHFQKTSLHSFKKPVCSPLSIVSTKLKDKYERISSPLPGLSKVCKSGGVNVMDDVIINDKCEGQNSEYIYRQLLELQEENKKLKTENGKLLDNCMTKEGEASILRTQLKTCQATVDNVRLEKIKVQEKAQMEWSVKSTAAKNQLDDLKTQLEFKNLEIIKMKEKCQMLESQKVKLTQVLVPTNDISMSQSHNNSIHLNNDSKIMSRKVKTASNSVQTDDKSYFLKINIPQREELSKLCEILPLIMEPTESQFSILDYNEKLKLSPNIQNKCRIFSTFHRLPTTASASKGVRRKNMHLNCIYEDLSYIATCKDKYLEKYICIFKVAKEVINDVQLELDTVHQRMTTAFQKEMDEKYDDVTSKMLTVEKRDLLRGRALYKEEQALLARRLTAILAYILEHSAHKNVITHLLEQDESNVVHTQTHSIINDINGICSLLEKTSCAILYSGFLLSITHLIEIIHKHTDKQLILQILKTIITSRPMPFVSCHIVKLLTSVCATTENFGQFCINGDSMDYDQDPCVLQILLKQIEAAMKCIGKQQLLKQAVENTQYIILLYSYLNPPTTCSDSQKQNCNCQLVLMQVLVYALRICSNFLDSHDCGEEGAVQRVLALAARGAGAAAAAGAAEGQLLLLCQRAPGNILSEITSTLLTVEEEPQSYSTNAWLGALETLAIAD
ncbi:unnamed protein product, partial [Brenthis ino]